MNAEIRYRAAVSYDGTEYAGWQVQPGPRTIQGELERALETVTGIAARVQSSGRTDAGVHARAQVIHFDLPSEIVEDRLRKSLNALLDPDVRVETVKRAPPGFHCRYSVKRKEYRYFIWNGEVVPPFVRRYRCRVARPLDVDKMNDAARLLEGERDFAAFSANPNREIDGTVRTLMQLTVRRTGPELIIAAVGDGFLYKMVRSLAGHLIRVGTGETDPEVTRDILASKTRTARVPTAPPEGLFLWRVTYR
jgi:tRNA pseudouridine38-40 synthase